jgi:predicted dithiol-disulfide oxidoreductase (DUF899 family)
MMFPRARGDDRPGPASGQTALLPLAQGPCPSCTAFLDQLDGAAEHAAQHINLAVSGKAPIERILTFAAERGWRHLRLLSSAGTTYNRDYVAEAPDGEQQPMLNVFHRDGDTIRHFWGSELFYAPEDPGKIPATSAPSNRSGTFTTSPRRDAESTGMSSWATDTSWRSHRAAAPARAALRRWARAGQSCGGEDGLVQYPAACRERD